MIGNCKIWTVRCGAPIPLTSKARIMYNICTHLKKQTAAKIPQCMARTVHPHEDSKRKAGLRMDLVK
eukprot:6341967-Amphidinium_carterae.1